MEWFNVRFKLLIKMNSINGNLNNPHDKFVYRKISINGKKYNYTDLLLYNNKIGTLKGEGTMDNRTYKGFAKKITLNNKKLKIYF